tara:strand:+ start:678 stop:965 length:288 start_codon:yes stop_codon:yes gene_type:complete
MNQYIEKVEVGMTLTELPSKGYFRSGSQPKFYRLGWDRKLMEHPNQWVCLEARKMDSGSLWTLAKNYNEKYGHLSMEFAARNINGTKTLWGRYTK